MVRIFLSLATLSIALLATTLVVGLLIGDLTAGVTEETLRFKTLHFLLGVLSALVVVLVNSIGTFSAAAIADAFGYPPAFSIGTVIAAAGVFAVVVVLDRKPTSVRVAQAWGARE